MDTAHRKIELQSPADLTYLVSNATRAAREKIDLHFPPSAAPETGDDAMKKRVEELVHEYIQATFANARANLSINGLEGKEMDDALDMAKATGEELEPYDTRLAAKLQKLSANIEALTLQLANLRRTAPEQAARAYAARLAEEQQAFAAAREAAEKEAIEKGTANVTTGAEKVRDWDEARRNWEQATTTLGGVKERIGETAARLGQARDAAEYLDGKVK